MIPGARFDESHVDLMRTSRREQYAMAQAAARADATALGHELGDWRTTGVVADDEATCRHCRRAVFLVYGDKDGHPLIGLKRSGTALRERCDPPTGVGRVKVFSIPSRVR